MVFTISLQEKLISRIMTKINVNSTSVSKMHTFCRESQQIFYKYTNSFCEFPQPLSMLSYLQIYRVNNGKLLHWKIVMQTNLLIF